MSRVAVVGGGSWGTALAAQLARAHHTTRLWLRDESVAQQINVERRNEAYLPGVSLPPGLVATTVLSEAVKGAEGVFVAVPSEFVRTVCRQLAPVVQAPTVIVSATKGIEMPGLRRMTEVVAEELPGRLAATLSGPSFAAEVVREQPTAVVVAANDVSIAEGVQRWLSTRTFRAYSSDDVIGVELAGSLKNVIAIAAGIVDGLGYGLNTVAALITRGLAEMTRLAVALGGRPDTLAGLAGLGDLVLTCTGSLSRNRRVGQALGSGKRLSEALAMTHMVAEGVPTTLAACALARDAAIEMPIAEQMRAVLYAGKAPREAVDGLMLRSLKRE